MFHGPLGADQEWPPALCAADGECLRRPEGTGGEAGPDGSLFYGLRSATVCRQFKRAKEAIGIDDQELTLYCARHTCATRLAEHASAFAVQTVLGHKAIATTARYVHASARICYDPGVLRGLQVAVTHVASHRHKPRRTRAAKSWCPLPDSNRHTRRSGILSPLRLPVPPSGHRHGIAQSQGQRLARRDRGATGAIRGAAPRRSDRPRAKA